MSELNSKINEKNLKINKEMVHIISYHIISYYFIYDNNFAIGDDGCSDRFIFL